jgi:hypothetical protein
VYGHDVADTGTGGSSGVTGRSYGRDVAAYDSGGVAAAGFFVAHELDLRRFDHCVGRLHHGRKTPAFDHS